MMIVIQKSWNPFQGNISSQGTEKTSQESFPDEVILKIFTYLSLLEVSNVGATCRRCWRISNDESLWKMLLGEESLKKVLSSKNSEVTQLSTACIHSQYKSFQLKRELASFFWYKGDLVGSRFYEPPCRWTFDGKEWKQEELFPEHGYRVKNPLHWNGEELFGFFDDGIIRVMQEKNGQWEVTGGVVNSLIRGAKFIRLGKNGNGIFFLSGPNRVTSFAKKEDWGIGVIALLGAPKGLFNLAVSGETLFLGGNQGQIFTYSLENYELSQIFEKNGKIVTALKYSEEILVSGFVDGALVVFEKKEGKWAGQELSGYKHRSHVIHLCIMQNTIVSTCDYELCVWCKHGETWKKSRNYNFSMDPISALDFDDVKNRLVVGFNSGKVTIFSLDFDQKSNTRILSKLKYNF